jgi:hypothetical protein
VFGRLARRAKAEARKAMVAAWRSAKPKKVTAASPPPPRSQVVYVPAPQRPRVMWPAYPPPGYLGQLDDAFQQALVKERYFIERDDCYFYHVTELPNGEVIDGPWDLRGCGPDYLGKIELEGKRVLEMGPASGYLTFWMESQGADVVGFDVGFDKCIDLLPVPGSDMRAERAEHMRAVGHVQNSWWYQHALRSSQAKMVYGDIYDMPTDLGHFEVAFYGAILLHLRDPFGALSSGGQRADTIVVTDAIQDWADVPDSNTMRFDPKGNEILTNWWTITPGAVVAMLARLGFDDVTMTRHVARHRHLHDMSSPLVEVPMYTLVANRR